MPDQMAIEAYMAKAEESLATAESEFASLRFNSCANRCYYACYQAAIAALLRADIGPRSQRGHWEHEYVHAAFEGVLIERRKLYPGSLRDVLPKGHDLRQIADYGRQSITQKQADRMLRRSRAYV
jgi:uncharacterized protein (UPF0332 family)